MRGKEGEQSRAEQTRLMEAFIHLTRPSDRSPSALKIPNRRKFNASSYIISPVCITYSIGFSIVPTSAQSVLPAPLLSFSAPPAAARILAYFTSLHDS